jgi:hypothetical protein
VAICLICLLGMLVLTFDLGRGVALKRNMVNGADAAALAAARECGLANGDVAAKQAATQLLADNNGAATILPGTAGFRINPGIAQCSGAPNPDPDHNPTVTVTVSVPQQYFFAPIFGFNNGTVVATATAEWTTGDTSPAPLKLEQAKIEGCLDEGVPDPVTKRVDCYFLFDKGSQEEGLESDWGWLNLPEGWPNQELKDPNPLKCSSQAGGSKDLGNYIGGMGGMGTPGGPTLSGSLLWDPTGAGNPPTWVCGATGLKQSNVDDIQTWVDNVKAMMKKDPTMLEPVVLFPIVACDPSKPLADSTCREWKYTPGVAYPVVKLQGFYVKEAKKGKDYAKEHCGYTGTSDRVFCIHLQTTGLDDPSSSGRPIVRLVG